MNPAFAMLVCAFICATSATTTLTLAIALRRYGWGLVLLLVGSSVLALMFMSLFIAIRVNLPL